MLFGSETGHHDRSGTLTSRRRLMKQGELFGSSQRLPAGFMYKPDFITPDEEAAFLAEIAALPLQEAKYKEYTATRRMLSYGGTYDFSSNELVPAGRMHQFLIPLRDRIVEWTKVPPERFTHAVIAEYKTGTQRGCHRDVAEFEFVVGVPLAGESRMRMGTYPPQKGKSAATLSI